jgi:DNA invertase Pin-like site-specific DNA recombinase
VGGEESMIYGYARVSTVGQGRNGNSLDNQIEALTQAGASLIYKDTYTGTSKERPEFEKVLSDLQEGDTLIITKLDRFARSLQQGCEIIDELINRGITVHVLNMGVLDNTPASKLMRNMFLAFAEFERELILERTQEGKQIARSKGIRVDGRPEKKIPKDEFQKFLQKQKEGSITVDECCKFLKISRSKWYEEKKKFDSQEIKDIIKLA